MTLQDVAVIPPAATATTLGGVRLAGDLARSDSVATAPLLNPNGSIPAHSHTTLMQPVSPVLHTNNYGGSVNLYPARSGNSQVNRGQYIYVLNSSATFTLRTDVTDSYSSATGNIMGIRQPADTRGNALAASQFGDVRGEDFAGDVTLLLIQDNTGGYTPTFTSYQSSLSLGVTPGSGTAGQWRLFVFRYLGPMIGWRCIHDSGSWSSGALPYSLNNSSTRGGQFVRGIVGTGGDQTTLGALLDQLVKTPSNYRKALYERGMMAESMSSGAVSAFYTGNQIANAINSAGMTYYTFDRHMVIGVPTTKTSTAEVTVHESGHAADFLLLRSGIPTLGKNVRDDIALAQTYWAADKTEWKNGGGVDNAGYDSITDLGWSGSQGYFVRTQTEWIAQVIGCHMHYKWAVATSNGTAQSDATAWFTKATNPSRHAALRSYLDTLLSAYI